MLALKRAVEKESPYRHWTRTVHVALADSYNEKEGLAWPSVAGLAKRIGWSERTIRYALERLERDGWIKAETGTALDGTVAKARGGGSYRDAKGERQPRSTRWKVYWPGEVVLGPHVYPAHSAGYHDRDTLQENGDTLQKNGDTLHTSASKRNPRTLPLTAPLASPATPKVSRAREAENEGADSPPDAPTPAEAGQLSLFEESTGADSRDDLPDPSGDVSASASGADGPPQLSGAPPPVFSGVCAKCGIAGCECVCGRCGKNAPRKYKLGTACPACHWAKTKDHCQCGNWKEQYARRCSKCERKARGGAPRGCR